VIYHKISSFIMGEYKILEIITHYPYLVWHICTLSTRSLKSMTLSS